MTAGKDRHTDRMLAGFAGSCPAPIAPMTTYKDFIAAKAIETPSSGFTIDRAQLHESNFPHQADTIEWAAKGGRRAIFSSFGLGKTQVQLELMRLCRSHNCSDSRPLLIICPLGVKQEFAKDAKRLGMPLQYVRTHSGAAPATGSSRLKSARPCPWRP